MNFREMTQQSNTHLTDEQLQRMAPSAFSTGPCNDVSERYGFVPTIDAINGLRDAGWFPTSASQKNVRKAENVGFTKHLIRFRRLGDDIMIGDSVGELLLTNSHDKTSSFSLHAGVFRMACANGIVIADNTLQKISVRHNRHAIEKVIEGSYHIIDEVPKIIGAVDRMQGLLLSHDEQGILAESALDLILPDMKEEQALVTPIDHLKRQVLEVTRAADNTSNLWVTFNRIQEKALRGGLRYMTRNTETRQVRRTTTREIKAIDRNIKLNKALWSLADKMADLKSAA